MAYRNNNPVFIYPKNPNPNYHNLCDPKAVNRLIEFLQSTGFMLVLSSSWRRSDNIYETFKSLDSIPYLNKISPYIIGQTCRLNSGRTNGKRWCRGDEIKVWVDGFKPSYYMIVDDDTDMLIEQFPRLIQTDPEHGLTYDDLIKLKCHFLKIQHKKEAWKEKFDFSFGDRILMYNYTTKSYE